MDQQLGMQCGNGASLTDQALSNLEIYGMGAIATFRTFSRRGMVCSFMFRVYNQVWEETEFPAGWVWGDIEKCLKLFLVPWGYAYLYLLHSNYHPKNMR